MCGICGFIHSRNLTKKELFNMNQTIHYRGPNDEGYYIKNIRNRQIGMAQKRLSILDLSQLGHQPMISDDETIIVVFNGEIYNFQNLRNKLIDKGYKFNSNTDTEVIIYAYKEWGIDCIKYFNGMFAIALLDKSKEEVYLIRDRMGVKPLYYYQKNGDFVFASELKPIMAYPFFSKQINKEALNMYLHHQYITAPHTIFENVYKVTPGCYLKYKNGRVTETKYWSVEENYNYTDNEEIENENYYINKLEDILIDSVKLRMISDVPIGAFLSGGVDSSLISALMQKQSSKPIKTFTIGFDEDKYNEAKYAKEIAKYLGTEHYERYLSIGEAKKYIEQIPKFYDEPFADNSQVATMLVSKIAKENVTVVLSGDAGDELFCGYDKYNNIDKLQKVASISKVINGINNIIPVKPLINKNINNRKYIKIFNLETKEDIINSDYLTFKDCFGKIVKGEFEINRKYYDILKRTSNFQEKYMLQDMITYLPDDILTKVDRATMSASLEARSPLLDYRVVEYALNLPQNLKRKDGINKYILKKVLYKYIPKKLIDRPKQGFAVPIDRWIREDFKRYSKNYFDKEFIIKQDLFDYDEINKVISTFKISKDPVVSKLVWTLIVFQMWYEEYIL